MALAERREELQRPKNGRSSSRRRTLQPRTTLLFTTTYGSILLLLLLFSLHCGKWEPDDLLLLFLFAVHVLLYTGNAAADAAATDDSLSVTAK